MEIRLQKISMLWIFGPLKPVESKKIIFLAIKLCFGDGILLKLLKTKASLFLCLEAACAELAEVSGLMSNFRTLMNCNIN